MATPWRAIQSRLYVQDTTVSPQVFVVVALGDDIEGPTPNRSTIDVTTHDVTDDYMVFIPSLKDGKDVVFSGIWDPTSASHGGTGYTSMLQALEDGITRHWKIVLPTSPSEHILFDGFVTDYKPSMKVKDALRFSITIKVTGKATIEAGS